MLHLKYSVPEEIPIIFHNGSNYDYHFVIKELAEKVEGQFNCLGKNTEKCTTSSIPIENEVTRVDKDWEKVTKTISYRQQYRQCKIYGKLIIRSFQ